MNPINENNLTEQSLIDWLKSEGMYLKKGTFNTALLIKSWSLKF